MIKNVMIRVNDESMRLLSYMHNAVVFHKRVVNTYRSMIDKYKKRGVRIFDEINVDPEMLKTRAPFPNDDNHIEQAPKDIRSGLLLFAGSDSFA